jgi:hypothetical protein
MRSKFMLAVTALALAAGFAFSSPAVAGGFDKVTAPAGYAQDRTVHHWVYYPRYHHVYHVADKTQTDPYAWNYSSRGYYPYHASQYWVPAEQMRYRYRYKFTGEKFKYHAAWGVPKKDYDHKTWHGENHGRHHRWHW